MVLTKVCECCGKEFTYPHWRRNTVKYCSRECSDKSKVKLNCTCIICGKQFHRKPYHLKKAGSKMGNCCSRECSAIARQTFMKGKGNHQYGIKGPQNASFGGEVVIQKNHKLLERMVYVPKHPFANCNGRVKEHRLIIEQNHNLFDPKYFTIINGLYYLLPSISVHHLDGNHNNNVISNLVPCTKGEHKQYHKSIITERDNKGRILKSKTAVVKQGELLGSPEVDNQQPSQPLTKLEGSETRC